MNEQTAQQKFERMTTAPVKGLIMEFALPSMAITMITSVYNLADTFFVGRIGTSATAAVGVVFSITMVMTAMGFWVGTGGSTLVSNLLGEQKREKAETIASTAVTLSMSFGVLIALVGYLGGNSLLRLLGATETILPYAAAYLRYSLMGAPFFVCNMGLGQLLRSEGLSRESMFGTMAGGILNMALDPLFIFVFGWGIAGAAGATALSQFVSWCVLIGYYVRGKTQLHLSVKKLSRSIADYIQLFVVGFPSLCRHLCNMLANVMLNVVAGQWGDAAIAAMSICSRLLYLSNMISGGMNNGCQPVIGYAYGNKNYARVREAFRFTVQISLLGMIAFGVVGLAFAPQMVGIFRDDPEVIAVGSQAFRLICLALPFAAFANSTNILFQIIKKPALSSALTLGRQILLYIPALLVLPRLLGCLGMQLAGPVADVVVGLVCVILILRYFKKMK